MTASHLYARTHTHSLIQLSRRTWNYHNFSQRHSFSICTLILVRVPHTQTHTHTHRLYTHKKKRGAQVLCALRDCCFHLFFSFCAFPLFGFFRQFMLTAVVVGVAVVQIDYRYKCQILERKNASARVYRFISLSSSPSHSLASMPSTAAGIVVVCH